MILCLIIFKIKFKELPNYVVSMLLSIRLLAELSIQLLLPATAMYIQWVAIRMEGWEYPTIP